ncbi:hypothetical protein M6B38_408785 [Iris pallida]|uniref:Secreted protein n=1 Tax=Iris pallida TaxID=29817 RepID=A0AAX6FMS1_IRIPA|nr:hypothetical protein M6B38_408785 [Iris pallida]
MAWAKWVFGKMVHLPFRSILTINAAVIVIPKYISAMVVKDSSRSCASHIIRRGTFFRTHLSTKRNQEGTVYGTSPLL